MPDEQPKTLAEIEKDAILASMLRNKDDKEAVARELDMGLTTLYRKLKSYGYVTPR